MRVGLVGAGRIGMFHAGTLTDHAEVSELLITDPIRERAEAAAADIGARITDDAESMIGAIDAMVIAAGTDAHAPLMHLAADAGIPVFCEKPLLPTPSSSTSGGPGLPPR